MFFEWNTATHVQDNEQSPVKRAFTKHELQDFFDYADDRVAPSRPRPEGLAGGLPRRDVVQGDLRLGAVLQGSVPVRLAWLSEFVQLRS